MEMPSSYYDVTFEEHEHWKHHYSQSRYYALWCLASDLLLVKNVTPSVIDIGCGSGQFAQLLHDKSVFKYLGIDFSQKRIEWAKNICPYYKFIIQDINKIDPEIFNEYSSVTCIECLEHLDNDLNLLSILPNGRHFVGSVPTFDNKAHVRFFLTIEDVIKRYAQYFDDFEVIAVNENHKTRYFVFAGVKKDTC